MFVIYHTYLSALRCIFLGFLPEWMTRTNFFFCFKFIILQLLPTQKLQLFYIPSLKIPNKEPHHQSARIKTHYSEQCLLENHTTTEVERNPSRPSSPTLCSRRVSQSRLLRILSSQALEYLQGRRLHSLSGQPVPAFDCTLSKKVGPYIYMELPVFLIVSIASWPFTSHQREESGSILSIPCHHAFICTGKIPLSLITFCSTLQS